MKPAFVLGVGGYASGPFVLAAAICRVPCAIWEPNAHPGLANRWLARFVDACYVVFPEAQKQLRNRNISICGMPVRAEIENAGSEARTDTDFHILCFGGSQGSRVISTALAAAVTKPELTESAQWLQGVKIVHQIGTVDWQRFSAEYKGYESHVTPLEFIFDMPHYYRWADLVVARGGASTIMEIAAFGLPAVIIPLPLADNHQGKNAESLVNAGAGKMILQSELTPARLVAEIESLRQRPAVREQMRLAARKLFRPQASALVANDILSRMSDLVEP